jgi:hydrophobe/amphiphile efflux-3 (HAE3) family protein
VNAARVLSALAGGAARRPRVVLAVAIVLGVGGAGLALRLRPTAATDTLVSSSSSSYRATQRFYSNFGEEPIVVLVKGNLQKLVLSSDIERLLGLEGCLSGNVPVSALAAEGGVDGPCGQLARAKTVKVVFGPGTFLNEAAEQIDKLLSSETLHAKQQAKQAEELVLRAALARGLPSAEAHALAANAGKVSEAGFESSLVSQAIEHGLTQPPSLEDKNFVSEVVFDPTKPAGTPRARFAYLFPSPNAALVSVRMKPGLSEAQRTRTIALIRDAVAMPQWHLTNGESYLVTGEPVIVADLTSSISHSIELLLIAVLLVMAATLGLVFAGRPRLLPLALALLAAAITFGALSAVGASLTMASIAVLPVLVGLAVDYAIQFQARVQEEAERVESRLEDTPTLVRRAAAAGAPTIATAGAASAAAMLVLLLSPVPMVRGFGVLLVVGVAVALLCALSAGAAAISLSARPAVTGPADGRWSKLEASSLALAWRGARELLADNPLTRLVSSAALVGSVRHPGRVLCIGAALAALGWGLDTQTKVQTDITKLVPQSLGSLQNLNTVEQITGVGGEIELLLEGSDLTKPATIEWMIGFQKRVFARFGYSPKRGCQHAQLCPAFSLPDLFEGQRAGSGAAPKLSSGEIDGVLSVIPAYFSEDVITANRHVAALAFGIRLMALDRQQRLIEQMRASLHPPVGVRASLVGLSVLAAQSGSQVADPWRRLETLLAGLAAVALVLLFAFRGERRRVFVPLVPIVLASGWSALILFAVRVPLNPMSVTLGALVIAISTEFSVLLSERHRQEMLAGHDTIEALRRSYRRTGAAVAASGTTAIMGFGVLVLSEIAMLRDFGLVTLIDLSVSLVGVLVALPATLVIAERAATRRASTRPTGASRRARGAWARP